MLTFLTGTYQSKKKTVIYEKISKLLKDNEKVFLIVPEQSSFDRERDFLFTYGEELGNKLIVTSFTHLARDVLEDNGLHVKPVADETAKNVLMSIAVEECSEQTEIFNKYSSKLLLVEKLISEYKKIKSAGLDVLQLYNLSMILPQGTLKQKTRECANIFLAYEGLLSERFSDSANNINVMTQFIKDNPVFKDTYVFFDDFRGFTGAQIKLIKEIISQTKESYISVLAPDSINSYDSTAFAHAVKNCRAIRRCADEQNIKCFEEKIDSNGQNPEIKAICNSIFCSEKEEYKAKANAVTIIEAENKYSECDTVALLVKKLITEEGYRCVDIGIYERTGTLVNCLVDSFKKYSVPVFEDKRVPLSEYPLVKMILFSLSIAIYGFNTEDVLSYIKTGITPVSDDECSLLEDYVYIWQIDKNDWLKPFENHPEGFGESKTEGSENTLRLLNEIREKIVNPILKLKKGLENENAAQSCEAVYKFLVQNNAAESFLTYARFMFDNGNEATSIECAGVWDYVMEALDALHTIVINRQIKPKRFYELLKIILSSGDIGRIPAGIDQIVIGQAGRTRHLEPKVVFVLGCNEGVFPEEIASSGIFTNSELRTLVENSFSLEKLPEDVYAEERMIAFSVLSNTTERLYISYPKVGSSGNSLQASEIVKEIKQIFPLCEIIKDKNIPPLDKILSKDSAFEEFAHHYNENTVYSASLKEFVKRSDMAHKEHAVRIAVDKQSAEIKDKAKAKELFGENMNISPSRAEVYYLCPFKYFCRYGLRLKTLTVQDLDSRINGLLIHHLLEKILISRSNKDLAEISEEELKQIISEITEEFITDYMGGRENKSILLNRSLDRTKETAFVILSRLIQECSVSKFTTVDVELNIQDNGDIDSYKLQLPDGGSVIIDGKVDRVDIMKEQDKVYLRVVDYKTGGKDFRLSDVFSGLNMQMLIYLMCIWQNGKERYSDIIPAGILYVPANALGDTLPREASTEDINRQRLVNGRMNGMILDNDEVIYGMENDLGGLFVNITMDSKGKIKGNLLSLNGFRKLQKIIDNNIIKMGCDLHNGKIPIYPVLDKSDHKNTCVYCEYKDVCKREDTDDHKSILRLTHAKAVDYLMGDDENV